MKIQEALIAFVFAAMIVAALLLGQKQNKNFFPLREWTGKNEFIPAFSGNIWVEPETGIELIWVQGGCFEMGCINDNRQCNPNEFPMHEVCLDGFWIGRYPVTQKQWMQISKENPSFFQKKADHPVENVSWHEVRQYIANLNLLKGQNVFRLPTEAEWEYACREKGSSFIYSGSMDPEEVAWHRGNSGSSTQPVGLRMPNKLGLFDMSGNVFEWVQDVYDAEAYRKHKLRNPLVDTGLGPAYDHYLTIIEPYMGAGSARVTRGGSWRHPVSVARCSSRYPMASQSRKNYLGFRIAADLPIPQNSE